MPAIAGDGSQGAGGGVAEPGAASSGPAGTTDAVEAAGPQESSGEAPSSPPAPGGDAAAGEASTVDLVRTALAGLSLFLAGAISSALVAGRRSQLFSRPIGRRVPRLEGAEAGLSVTMARARDVASGGVEARDAGPGGGGRSHEPSGRVTPTGVAVDEDPPPVDADDLPPASVVLGTDREDRPVLLDLARTDGWLGVLGNPADAAAMVSSVALSLTCTRWSEGLEVVAVGPGLAWLGRVGRDDVELAGPGQLDDELAELGRRPRPVPDEPPPVTRVILMDTVPHAALPDDGRSQASSPDPRVLREAGVVLVSPISSDLLDAATTVVHLENPEIARMGGRAFAPQLVAEPVRRGIVTLVEATGTDRTEPAPWWDHGRGPARAEPARAVSLLPLEALGPDAADPIPIRPTSDRAGPVLSNTPQAPPQGQRPPARALSEEADVSPGTTREAPVLNVLGTVELTGARGPEPSKGRQQCLEYCRIGSA